jgi:hypothetical protein
LNQFKECGKKHHNQHNVEFESVDCTWYNGKQMVIDFSLTPKNSRGLVKHYIAKLKKEHSFNVRSQWTKDSMFTSNSALLDAVLANHSLTEQISAVRYTSSQYEQAMEALSDLSTGVKIVKNKQAGRNYVIQLKPCHSISHAPLIKNLNSLIEANCDRIEISARAKKSLDNGWCREGMLFYCSDPDTVMLIHLSASNIIHKIYKIIERN